jgi:hypothetical protein
MYLVSITLYRYYEMLEKQALRLKCARLGMPLGGLESSPPNYRISGNSACRIPLVSGLEWLPNPQHVPGRSAVPRAAPSGAR